MLQFDTIFFKSTCLPLLLELAGDAGDDMDADNCCCCNCSKSLYTREDDSSERHLATDAVELVRDTTSPCLLLLLESDFLAGDAPLLVDDPLDALLLAEGAPPVATAGLLALQPIVDWWWYCLSVLKG